MVLTTEQRRVIWEHVMRTADCPGGLTSRQKARLFMVLLSASEPSNPQTNDLWGDIS